VAWDASESLSDLRLCHSEGRSRDAPAFPVVCPSYPTPVLSTRFTDADRTVQRPGEGGPRERVWVAHPQRTPSRPSDCTSCTSDCIGFHRQFSDRRGAHVGGGWCGRTEGFSSAARSAMRALLEDGLTRAVLLYCPEWSSSPRPVKGAAGNQRVGGQPFRFRRFRADDERTGWRESRFEGSAAGVDPNVVVGGKLLLRRGTRAGRCQCQRSHASQERYEALRRTLAGCYGLSSSPYRQSNLARPPGWLLKRRSALHGGSVPADGTGNPGRDLGPVAENVT
jgi:hypothetical protein